MLRQTLILLLCSAPFFSAAGAAPPQFRLHDVQGGVHTSAEWSGQRAILLFFVTTDCPAGNSYVPEMNRIHDAYASRGVAVYAVQADPGVAEAEVARYAKDYRYGFPLLLDPDQVLHRPPSSCPMEDSLTWAGSTTAWWTSARAGRKPPSPTSA
jgi:peroxiredoxin